MNVAASVQQGELIQSRPEKLSDILKPVSIDLTAAQDMYHHLLLDLDQKEFIESLLSGQDWSSDILKVGVVQKITGHLLQNDGKWIRAAIVMLTAGMGNIRDESVHQVAITVELVHIATLVHDDIIDQAPMRRGYDSVQLRWGNSVAVLMGDLLFAKAFELLFKSGSTDSQFHLMQATNQMCLGEIKQLSDSDPSRTTEQEYLQMIEFKTASLMGAAAASGASLAGFSAEQINQCKTYGHSLGMAFQIIDDILDYTSPSTVMGKEQGEDLRNGKATLPLIHLIQADPKSLQTIFDSTESLQQKTLQLSARMRETGSIEYAYEQARKYADLALTNLSEAEAVIGKSKYSESLRMLVDFILRRDH